MRISRFVRRTNYGRTSRASPSHQHHLLAEAKVRRETRGFFLYTSLCICIYFLFILSLSRRLRKAVRSHCCLLSPLSTYLCFLHSRTFRPIQTFSLGSGFVPPPYIFIEAFVTEYLLPENILQANLPHISYSAFDFLEPCLCNVLLNSNAQRMGSGRELQVNDMWQNSIDEGRHSWQGLTGLTCVPNFRLIMILISLFFYGGNFGMIRG